MGEGAPVGVSSTDAPRDDVRVASSRVAVEVQVPEGFPKWGTTITFEPASGDEFYEVVDAFGGPGGFVVLLGFAAKVVRPDLTVHVMRPKDQEPHPAQQLTPFMDQFLRHVEELS